jgi:trehalose 6-phosphate phosphatase
MQSLPALNPRDSALFLDFDGTLAELAAQPAAVRVPSRLVPLLDHLSEHLQGALALVSGRPLADLDAMLAPLRLPVAAEHGAVRRGADGQLLSVPAPDLETVTRVARALARQHAGLQVEVKTAAVALHYRQAPALESLCLQHLSRAVMATPGVELLHGKCVMEVKPVGVNKGHAIAAFMREPPFAGRTPWFAGDDTTDEAGFAWVQAAGGQCLKVGTGPSLARHRCTSPQALRDWLSDHLTSSHSQP